MLGVSDSYINANNANKVYRLVYLCMNCICTTNVDIPPLYILRYNTLYILLARIYTLYLSVCITLRRTHVVYFAYCNF